MAGRYLSAKNAAALDAELMSSGAFSLDQLMELAGLSVSQAVYRVFPPTKDRRNVLIACGPGNNGGDGLVAARHLHHYGYNPTIFYPKPGRHELYTRLTTQLRNLDIPFTHDFGLALRETHHVVDAIFGFSFKGEIRAPFDSVIGELVRFMKEQREKGGVVTRVTSVDAPSGWDIEDGPPAEGPASGFMPDVLVSLTAPKPLVERFGGRHFVGGRFLPEKVAEKFGIEVPRYEGIDQIVEEVVKKD